MTSAEAANRPDTGQIAALCDHCPSFLSECLLSVTAHAQATTYRTRSVAPTSYILGQSKVCNKCHHLSMSLSVSSSIYHSPTFHRCGLDSTCKTGIDPLSSTLSINVSDISFSMLFEYSMVGGIALPFPVQTSPCCTASRDAIIAKPS